MWTKCNGISYVCVTGIEEGDPIPSPYVNACKILLKQNSCKESDAISAVKKYITDLASSKSTKLIIFAQKGSEIIGVLIVDFVPLDKKRVRVYPYPLKKDEDFEKDFHNQAICLAKKIWKSRFTEFGFKHEGKFNEVLRVEQGA